MLTPLQGRTTYETLREKRQVLVVDDELINREILGVMLQDEYDVVFAVDGTDALEKIEQHKDTLSLILLDLIMPNLHGQEVLRRIKESPDTQRIPVIVANADHAQEIECLDAGASDFIQKPYPTPGVVTARVRRIIELSEDRAIIQSTERDPLTGLLNREFFYSYAEQYDQHHKDTPMDAIVLDINHFIILSERHGRAYADEVLRRVGQKAREMVHDDGGIVCRREGDTFLVYCPHRDDYKAILDNASQGLTDDDDPGASNRVRLRMGVYANVDKSLDVERRFDRAQMAADTVRNSYTRNIGVYDDTLHKSELYAEQLVDDFETALAERQFVVHYQPKYDIRPDVPALVSAEALVRWQHPTLGSISPGVFIPLFEENGLIQALDSYVWHETARQIRAWKDELGCSVPVSVNASRVDMYDPNIVYTLLSIIEEHGLSESDLHLEVTESAYAEDSEQIIETVKRLRGIGFQIEMDDFGTGYSSLNMLAALPIDALKLDMGMVRSAFAETKDTHMLEVIIEIAEHLDVPVIAEGVETEEQMTTLRSIGCDMVQGYYFSPPVPPEKFADFLKKEAAADGTKHDVPTRRERIRASKDTTWWDKMPGIPMRVARAFLLVLAAVVAIALIVSDSMMSQGYLDMIATSERYIGAQQAATNLEVGSDNLTSSVRNFVATGDIKYLDEFFQQAEVTKQRDNAVLDLETLVGDDTENPAYQHLLQALELSNELMGYEYQAMRLTLDAGGYDAAQIPATLQNVQLTPEQQAMTAQEKHAAALELVYGDTYEQYKERIRENTVLCTQELIAEFNADRLQARQDMNGLIVLQIVLTVLILAVVVMIAAYIEIWVRLPITRMVNLMHEEKPAPPSGAREMRYVAETYNKVLEANRERHERLAYGTTHDALTGLFNRKAFDVMREDMNMADTAVLLIDVDKFKAINDTFGHGVGDMVLKRVAEVLSYSFRATDLVFRLGGDEFVIIMVQVNSSISDQVKAKVDQANMMLQKPQGDLPPTSLSVGVAFADRVNPEGDIFADADTALYRVKASGRCGCVIY